MIVKKMPISIYLLTMEGKNIVAYPGIWLLRQILLIISTMSALSCAYPSSKCILWICELLCYEWPIFKINQVLKLLSSSFYKVNPSKLCFISQILRKDRCCLLISKMPRLSSHRRFLNQYRRIRYLVSLQFVTLGFDKAISLVCNIGSSIMLQSFKYECI